MASVNDLTKKLSSPSKKDIALITQAYSFAKTAHRGTTRYSGEPYFNHVFQTANTLAELGMSRDVIIAGLLHDTIEDAGIKPDTIEFAFGSEVLFLVEGVTKLGKIKYRGVERHVESLRKLFIATSSDIRVLIIKLADRHHNMTTLEYVPKAKQKRIALETMDVYAPIAHRLGMGKIMGELQDLAFPYLYPKEYEEVKKLAEPKRKEKTEKLTKLYKVLSKELKKEKIYDVKTDYRLKHLFSIYEKLKRKDFDIDRVYDISALRVVVPTISDCYKVLGLVHSIWRPLPGRIKDYIAFPKPNGYQSIHTTIFTGEGDIAEIQIRTEKMNEEAEYGIASHVGYKGKGSRSLMDMTWVSQILKNVRNSEPEEEPVKISKDAPEWVQELASTQKEVKTTDEFLGNLKDDFFGDRIFAFTPKGDVIDLPKNASPVDFAYHIHTDVGDHIAGVMVNGKMVSLDTELKNGDIVDVQTKKNSHPTRKWLSYANTTLARRRIKSYLQKKSKK